MPDPLVLASLRHRTDHDVCGLGRCKSLFEPQKPLSIPYPMGLALATRRVMNRRFTCDTICQLVLWLWYHCLFLTP